MTDTLIVLLVSFVGLMLIGLPVAWSLLASMLAWVAYGGKWSFLPIAAERIWQGMDVFVLMSVPLFVLAGELVNEDKITDRLIHFANVIFGRMRGGLAQVNIGASILFSGITGVALGDIAALGQVLIPAMVKQGYTAAYAAAVTASSSIIGPMVPPSLIAVIYGSMTGLSIGALMAATLIPGLLIGLLQMILVAFHARKHNFPRVEMQRSPAIIARATGDAMVPLMVPVIILGGLLSGIITPTEAGAVAAAYALVVGVVVYRSLRVKELGAAFQRSAMFSGQLLIIVGCGAAFSWVMGMENVPQAVGKWVADWNLGYATTLLVFNGILLVLGMFIDPTTTIILFGPLLSAAAMQAGINPLHFGAVAILNLNIGLLTPPLGVCLFAAERIAKCGLGELLRANTPFLLITLFGLLLVSVFPGFSLWLPRVLGF